tara:strand:- start:5964 stop:8045 length:2082 start_codon:yes stop_codon:yes gene_type:complete
MRIPTYTASFNPSNRAPGASIRARKSFSVAKAELDKAAPVNEFVNQVREVALQRYRVAEELKLDENLLAASDQLRQLEYDMGRDSNIYSVLDGDNPRWQQRVAEIKATLRNNIGTNVNSVMKFESKFNIAEQGARLRLRSKIDTAIAARAALAKKQKENAVFDNLNSRTTIVEQITSKNALLKTSSGNFTRNEAGEMVITEKGKIALQTYHQTYGVKITSDFIKDDPSKGDARVFDLIAFHNAEGNTIDKKLANLGFDDAQKKAFMLENPPEVLFALSQMTDADGTELLNKLLDDASQSRKKFDDFTKRKEAEVSENKSTLITRLQVIPGNGKLGTKDAINKAFDQFLEGTGLENHPTIRNGRVGLIDTLTARTVFTVDVKRKIVNFLNDPELLRSLRITDAEQKNINEAIDPNVEEYAFRVTRGLSGYRPDLRVAYFTPIKEDLDALLEDGALTNTLLRKMVEDYTFGGKSLDRFDQRDILKEYAEKIKLQKEDNNAYTTITNIIKEEKNRTGASLLELRSQGLQEDTLYIAAAKFVNDLEARLREFVRLKRTSPDLNDRQVTTQEIQDEYQKYKATAESEFQSNVAKDMRDRIAEFERRARIETPLAELRSEDGETAPNWTRAFADLEVVDNIDGADGDQLLEYVRQAYKVSRTRLNHVIDVAPGEVALINELKKQLEYFKRAAKNFGMNF